MNERSFIDRLKFWRCERPDEWVMDDFIRQAVAQQDKIDTLRARVKELEIRLGEKIA